MRYLKFYIIIQSLLLSSLSFSSGIDGDILKYTEQLDKKYQEIARSLFLVYLTKKINQSHITDFSSVSYKEIRDYKNVGSFTKRILEIVYGDGTIEEKEVSFRDFFLKLDNIEKQWISVGISGHLGIDSLYSYFSNINELCTEKSFSEAMSAIESIPCIEGLKLNDLTKAVEVGISVTIDDEGVSLDQPSINVEESKKNEGKNKHMTSSIAGATAAMMAQYIATGSMVGPYGAAAMAIAVVVVATVELVMSIRSISKHNKEMKKILAANKELYSKMDFETNVKNYFMKYCKPVEIAFKETRNQIIGHKEGKTKLEAIETIALKDMEYLTKIGFIKDQKFNNEFHSDSMDDEFLRKLFSWKILTTFVQAQSNRYQFDNDWKEMIKMFHYVNSIAEDYLYKSYFAQNYELTEKDKKFIIVFDRVQELEKFKEMVNLKMSDAIMEDNEQLKAEIIKEIKDKIISFEITRDVIRPDEAKILERFKGMITLIE
jgi:hypothetical protein